MEKQPRCTKCGRVLKSPASIVLGMGPGCAGVSTSSSQNTQAPIRHSFGQLHQSVDSQSKTPLFSLDLPNKRLGKRELVRRRREERRRLFETRKPFRCGMLLPERTPLGYVPQDDGTWKEDPSGRVISHERLQDYLLRYRFI